ADLQPLLIDRAQGAGLHVLIRPKCGDVLSDFAVEVYDKLVRLGYGGSVNSNQKGGEYERNFPDWRIHSGKKD
ncbi:MAG TPA: hypothetical protein VJ417_08410, partial [Candidatus Glassbacteria bacterium]|nr:hypothetical protein [Candidatus Glassbacteria bacterium]